RNAALRCIERLPVGRVKGSERTAALQQLTERERDESGPGCSHPVSSERGNRDEQRFETYERPDGGHDFTEPGRYSQEAFTSFEQKTERKNPKSERFVASSGFHGQINRRIIKKKSRKEPSCSQSQSQPDEAFWVI
ncbi:Hypothetical protein SMAX5B_001427, partial [Scophthalmus maximus]